MCRVVPETRIWARAGTGDRRALRDRRDPCRPVDPETHVAVAGLLCIAGVDADPDADRGVVRPRLCPESTLDSARRGDPLPRLLEIDEERVALRAELVAAVRRPGLAGDRSMPRQQLRVAVAPDRPLERRRAFDVREQEGQRPAR